MMMVALSCMLSPTDSVTLLGATVTETTPKSGSPTAIGTSQAAARRPAANAIIVRIRITPPGLRVRFGGSTGVARGQRAVASGLCVPGFRRVCLCRAPSREGCDPAELPCVNHQNDRPPGTQGFPESLAAGLTWRPTGRRSPLALRRRLSAVLL